MYMGYFHVIDRHINDSEDLAAVILINSQLQQSKYLYLFKIVPDCASTLYLVDRVGDFNFDFQYIIAKYDTYWCFHPECSENIDVPMKLICEKPSFKTKNKEKSLFLPLRLF